MVRRGEADFEWLEFATTLTDRAVFSGVILLCAVALEAGYIAANRASHIDPMVALRIC